MVKMGLNKKGKVKVQGTNRLQKNLTAPVSASLLGSRMGIFSASAMTFSIRFSCIPLVLSAGLLQLLETQRYTAPGM
ncbi:MULTISPECIES: hypothetical protein [unclassified Mesorhizobium]|uniref:hypothetical protein n=1 Tax=unclassified Mesorhizobium TaxID=325217 RepID=UPI00333AEAD7